MHPAHLMKLQHRNCWALRILPQWWLLYTLSCKAAEKTDLVRINYVSMSPELCSACALGWTVHFKPSTIAASSSMLWNGLRPRGSTEFHLSLPVATRSTKDCILFPNPPIALLQVPAERSRSLVWVAKVSSSAFASWVSVVENAHSAASLSTLTCTTLMASKYTSAVRICSSKRSISTIPKSALARLLDKIRWNWISIRQSCKPNSAGAIYPTT